MELEKNQFYTVKIESYGSDGAGVCRIDGRAVFVPRALVDEEWEIRIVKATKSAVFARGETLLVPSPERREPPCAAFGLCGGCDLLHMSEKEELRFKSGRVHDALRHIGGVEVGTVEVVPSPVRESYRGKGIYAVGETREGAPVVGFYRRRSHDIIPVSRCLIQKEASDLAAAAVRDYMEVCKVPAYHEKTGRGAVRHVFSRCTTDGKLMVVIVSAKKLPQTETLVSLLRERLPQTESIQLCLNAEPGNTVLAGKFITLYGSETLTQSLCGLEFRLSAQSFFQINPPQAEALYAEAVRLAAPKNGGRVMDLYCGTGTISLCLAAAGLDVIGVEVVPEAVADARSNAARNGLSHAEFLCADASEAAKMLAERGEAPVSVVVDPPRKGMTPEGIAAIAKMAPEKVVYVSCDPATLARDVKTFAEFGYTPKSVKAFDMFPHCANVETICLLMREK